MTISYFNLSVGGTYLLKVILQSLSMGEGKSEEGSDGEDGDEEEPMDEEFDSILSANSSIFSLISTAVINSMLLKCSLAAQIAVPGPQPKSKR